MLNKENQKKTSKNVVLVLTMGFLLAQGLPHQCYKVLYVSITNKKHGTLDQTETKPAYTQQKE